MAEFFRKMYRGVFFIVLSPVAAVLLTFYSVYGLLLFIFMSFKSIPVFLKGGSILEPTDFDLSVEKRLITEQKQKTEQATQQPIQQGPTINVILPEGFITSSQNNNQGQLNITTEQEIKEIDYVASEEDK